MNFTDMVIISRSDYGIICLIAGLGWGFGLTTFVAALIIDSVKWKKWIAGR